MRIYIISPCRSEDIWRKRRSTFSLPPMSLAILAALTPPGVEVKVTDEMVDDIDFSYPADAVALSVSTTSAPRSYQVARAFREKGARVIMGGIHPTVMPEEALEHADCVVKGEAEPLWDQVVSDLGRGSLRNIYEGGYPDPESIPMPKWDVLPESRYFVQRTFQVSRGCPYGCSFCSSTSFFGTKYRFKPIERVVEEIKSFRKRFIIFIDDNIVGNHAYARELFSALRPLGKRWVAQASVDIAKDDSLLKLARSSGCAGILIGFESVSYDNKHDVRKLRQASDYDEALRKIRGSGISVQGSFVFGFDHDGPAVFDDTYDFVMRNRLAVANFCTLTPFPGTRLYGELLEQGRITESDWSRYDRFNVVYRPEGITPEELMRKTSVLYRRIFSVSSMLRRMPSRLENIPYYFAINLSYRLGSSRRR